MNTRTTRSSIRSVFALCNWVALLLCGCGPAHIGPHTQRERHYVPGPYERAPQAVSAGSLWQDTGRGLFADFRASKVGDILTVRIDETVLASGDSSTDTSRESSMSMGIPNFFGLTAALQRAHPNLNPEELLNLIGNSEFKGEGETNRQSQARGIIAVRVKQQLPNFDLFVEGTKVILVNEEELHIYISGVIRPEDIGPDNSVKSSTVADAQIEFTGRGVLTDNQQQGWLAKLLAKIRPF